MTTAMPRAWWFPMTGVLLAALVAHAAAQEQPRTFRSSVDLVSVDVSVIGDGGKPVTGLTAADFALTVDGKPRRVTSAEFISAARDAKAAASGGNGTNGGAAPAPFYSTNADAGGRLILFLVDQGTINRGRARPVMESLGRFVAQLSPSDKTALVAFPGSAAQIDFTLNHELVKAALPKLVGEADTFDTIYRIGISEALDVQRGDRVALTRLIDRECVQLGAEELEHCRTRVQFDAISVASLVRERSQNSLAALRAVADRLAAIDAPKTVVFVTEGLIVEGAADLAWLAPAAARSQLTFQVLHLDSPAADASFSREPPTPGRDRALGQEGLDLLAGTTRGGVFRVFGNADAAMNRLAVELSGHYLLGFEPDPAERDGRPHRIKVDVPGRAGIEIRARGEFAVDAAPTRTTDARLADLLKAPLAASGIGLKLGVFTLKDAATSQLRLLMVLEIDRAANPDGAIALAYSLTDDTGRIVSTQIDRDVKTPVHPESRTQAYTGFIPAEAGGVHTLKVAVVDGRGRRGSVEHRFRPALTAAGTIEAADLLLADSREGGGSAIPALGAEFTSGMVNGYLELYGGADVLKTTMVMFEVADGETGRALDGAVGKPRPDNADQPGRRAIEGTLPTALLPPGDYVVRAVIMAGGKRIGQVTRPFKVGQMVVATKAAATVGLRASSRATSLPQFSSSSDKFDRAAVLKPDVVSYFVDRLNVGERGEANPDPIVEAAKAGRFEDAMASLTTRTGTVPAAFLEGLSLLAKGELEPAAAKFRETLRYDSEFFPAAFYLGSCYAAGGRDDHAVGAWQLSLVTERDAPFIYALIGDALLRQNDVDDALNVLNDGARLWPDDDEIQVRLGAVYAKQGKRDEALRQYESYLATHPASVDRLFAAMRLVYEARRQSKPIRSSAEDRDLFTKWAAAYAAAKGPQQALVDQWQRAIAR